jgi:hypothetical protein
MEAALLLPSSTELHVVAQQHLLEKDERRPVSYEIMNPILFIRFNLLASLEAYEIMRAAAGGE